VANLRGADLRGANLREANLRGADLREADLSEANLRGAYLRGADLYRADLSGAYLRGADLSEADLSGAYLRGANLNNCKIEFNQFPSIRLLSSINLKKVSDKLTLELMRRDADGHPVPERFDTWADGGMCPYQNEERMWHFKEDRNLWKSGKPRMTDRELILAICEEKNWGIRGHLGRVESK